MFKYQRPEVLNGRLLSHSPLSDPLGKSYPQCMYAAAPSNLIFEGKVMRISSPAAPAPEMNKSCIATGSLFPLGSGDSGSLGVGKQRSVSSSKAFDDLMLSKPQFYCWKMAFLFPMTLRNITGLCWATYKCLCHNESSEHCSKHFSVSSMRGALWLLCLFTGHNILNP